MSRLAKVEHAVSECGILPLVEQAVAGAFASKSWSKRDSETLGLRVASAILDTIHQHVRNQPQGDGD